VFLQQPLEAWDNRKPCWFFAGQNVRKCFAFPIIVGLSHPSSVFHILDSLSTSDPAASEVVQLQKIFLMCFDGESFKEGRIAVDIAQVPHRPSFLGIY
jgi:hypothetical protein